MDNLKLKTIINEEIHLAERERRYNRRERDPNRQPRVGKEFKSGGKTFAKSRESNSETRQMREQITKYVYEARDLVRKHFGVTPPRVTYRVVDWTPEEVIKNNYAGCAYMGGRVLMMPASSFDGYSEIYIRHIVFHELLHAIYCVDHDESSKLMAAHLPSRPISPKEMDDLYVKHVEESGKSDLSDERGERRRY